MRMRSSDSLAASSGYDRPTRSRPRIRGFVEWELRGEDGELKASGRAENLITQYGDQFYGERANAIGTHDVVSGMKLGTGTTTPAKTGAGAAIVTYVSGSNKGLDGTYPQSSLSGASRRITFKTTWAAGEGTATGIAEAVVTNQTPNNDNGGGAGNTLSRALLSPVVNKGAGDTLAITWNHDLLGA